MPVDFFYSISIILVITVVMALMLRYLRQPLVVAYLLAGILTGPVWLNLIAGQADLWQSLAHFGIILLLFIIGLSLRFSDLRHLGRAVVIAGLLQLLITTGLGWVVLSAIGVPTATAFFLAIATTFSSTIVVVKILSDKRDTETVYGRFTIALLVWQDILAIGLLIALQTLPEARLFSIFSYAIWMPLVKGALTLSALIAIAKYVLPRLLRDISRVSELLFLSSLGWCFLAALAAEWIGLGAEVGALMAGLALATSPYQPEIASRLRPLRDFFLILFFILLGSQLQIGDLGGSLLPALVLACFVLIVDPLILYGVMRAVGHTPRNAFLTGTTAAQVSEFGFILLLQPLAIGLIAEDALTILTIVALVTIILSSYLITHNEKLFELFRPLFARLGDGESKHRENPAIVHRVWIIGYHRIGAEIGERLKKERSSSAVVDFNPEVVELAKADGFTVYFGDISDIAFLEWLPLKGAKLIISTIPNLSDQILFLRHARRAAKNAALIATVTEKTDQSAVYRAGADYAVMPYLLGADWLANAIEEGRWQRRRFRRLRDDEKK